MDNRDVDSLLQEIQRQLRQVVLLEHADLISSKAEEQLQSLWKSVCRLARVADSTELGARQQTQAWGLIRISRETINAKRGLIPAGSGAAHPGGLDDDDGSAGVLAFVKPVVPPRTGHDAKAFPPDDAYEDE